MMQRELLVYLDIDGEAVPVGRLWARERTGKETSSFEYDPGWLNRRGAFALSPSLMLARGQFQSAKGIAAAFSDTAPDSWGRKLMLRRERARAKKAKAQPRTLFDIDYLAGVDDQTRMGALRFRDVDGANFLTSTGEPVPPLIDLARLLSATDRIERDKETDEDLKLVLAPGTSLGGARPKATIRDGDGALLIAKFPKRDDDWPVTLWEAVLLDLAKKASIQVPPWRVDKIAKKPVLLVRRFDRDHMRRIPFMSAMTALDATDHGDQRSYLEILDVIRQVGSSPEADIEELWRRMVFNVLVSNTDDHLRNHAFLHDGKGWRLSPAYDLNPSPVDVNPRSHSLALNEVDASSSLETVLEVAEQFGIKLVRAKEIAGEVGAAVSDWKTAAKTVGLKGPQIERMETAFEHDDLKQARELAAGRATAPVAKRGPAKKAAAKPRKAAGRKRA
jgi:serine/threonine-protein kinase HipA